MWIQAALRAIAKTNMAATNGAMGIPLQDFSKMEKCTWGPILFLMGINTLACLIAVTNLMEWADSSSWTGRIMVVNGAMEPTTDAVIFTTRIMNSKSGNGATAP